MSHDPIASPSPVPTRHADVIIVGARCAGASMAMLLAEAGLEVIVLDESTADTEPMSTLLIQPEGVALLERWGVHEDVARLGAPPLTRIVHRLEDIAVDGEIASDGHAASAPRRPAIDNVLVARATDAGAEILYRTRVTSLLSCDGKVTGVEARMPDGRLGAFTADLVIGADGVRSTIAKKVGAETFYDDGALTCAYYAFLPAVGPQVRLFETDGRLISHIPTSGGDAAIAVYHPRAQFAQLRRDPRTHFLAALAQTPELAHLADRSPTNLPGFTGTGRQPNYLRRAVGEGWLLLGDAAHCRDSITALGIGQAFRQAHITSEIVANELGSPSMTSALESFWVSERDRLTPAYRATLKLARLQVDTDRRSFLRAVVAAGRQSEYMRALTSGNGEALLDSLLDPAQGGIQ